jgi:zinc protease
MQRLLLALALTACAPPPKLTPTPLAADSPLQKEGLRYTSLQLPSGLTLIVEENHAAPVAAIELWVKAGAADEPAGQAGVARLTQRMIVHGGKKHTGALEREVEAVGGAVSAWSAYDQSVFQVVSASRFFDGALTALAEAVTSPDFDDGEIKKEVAVARDELRRASRQPSREISRLLFETAFTQHAYRRSALGTEESVSKLGHGELEAFYKRAYRTNNIAIVVTGDVNPQALRAAIDKRFAGLGKSNDARTPRAAEPPQKEPREKTVAADVPQTYVAFAWHIPAVIDVDVFALDVLAVILGQGETSRLTAHLKHDRSIVSDTYAFAYLAKDPGLLTAGLSAIPSRASSASAALLGEIYSLRADVVSPSELEKAKRIILNDNFYGRQTAEGSARKLGFFTAVADDASLEDRYFRSIYNVSADDVRRVANKYLTATNMTAVALVPKGDGFKAASLVGEADKQEKALAARGQLALPKPGALAVYRVTLPSGAVVLVQEDHRVPTIAVRASFIGGIRDETPQNNGIGNLLARLITRGTKKRSAADIRTLVDNSGASIDGFSGQNIFGLRGDFLKASFDQGLELLAEMLAQPSFAQDELDRERAVVLEEIRGREDSLSSRAFDLFAQTLYDTHPFRLKPYGTVESVSALKAEDLAAFYRANYPVGRMVLSVVGDVSAARVLAQLQRLFGNGDKVEASHTPADDPPLAAPRNAERNIERQQAAAVLGFRGVRVKDADRYALDLLSAVLAGPSGTLSQDLVDKQQLALRVNGFAIEGLEPGYFAIYLAAAPDKMDAALNATKKTLATLAQAPLAAGEIDRAKRYLMGTHAMSLEAATARAAAMAIGELYGLGYDNDLHYDDLVSKLTAADLTRVAQQYLDMNRLAVAIVRPKRPLEVR